MKFSKGWVVCAAIGGFAGACSGTVDGTNARPAQRADSGTGGARGGDGGAGSGGRGNAGSSDGGRIGSIAGHGGGGTDHDAGTDHDVRTDASNEASPDGAPRDSRDASREASIAEYDAGGGIVYFQIFPVLSFRDRVTIADITIGPDDDIWFTAVTGTLPVQPFIGRMTPSGEVTRFYLTAMDAGPNAPTFITTAGDGNLWFSTTTNRIGRITPFGAITEFETAQATSYGAHPQIGPFGPIPTQNREIWFAEGLKDWGRVTYDGVVTDGLAPAGDRWDFLNGGPTGVWDLAQVSADGGFVDEWRKAFPDGGLGPESPLLSGFQPRTVGVSDPAGNLWIAGDQAFYPKLLELTASGEQRLLPVQELGKEVALRDASAIWIVGMTGLERVDAETGTLAEYPVPTPETALAIASVGGPARAAVARDGTVWFTYQIGLAVSSPIPTPGIYASLWIGKLTP